MVSSVSVRVELGESESPISSKITSLPDSFSSWQAHIPQRDSFFFSQSNKGGLASIKLLVCKEGSTTVP